MKKKYLSHGVILLISFIIVSLPFLGRTNTIEEFTTLDELFFKRGLISSVIVVVFFVFNYYVFIPKIYFKKKYFYYALVVLLALFLTYYIPTFIISSEEIQFALKKLYPDSTRNFRNRSIIEKIFLDRNAYSFYLTFIIAIILRIHRQLQDMEQLRIQSELAYLKAQINPHFLFNTLNSIYALALIKSDQTPKAILKISSLMRYLVTESEKELIDLEKEINYLEDYIELQKIRIENNTNILFEKNISANDYKISPMILVPFVENAFKYGINPAVNSTIHVKIEQKDNSFYFYCFNDIVTNDISTIEKTGTGIVNTTKRLESIYPNTHQLTINETEKTFTVILKIKK